MIPREPVLHALFLLTLSLTHALLFPGSLIAQAGPGMGGDSEVGAALMLGTGVTWFGGQSVPTVSAAGTLRLSHHLDLGGQGLISLRSIPATSQDASGSARTTVGSGGLLLRWRPAGDLPGVRWGGSLHVGAGAARIQTERPDGERSTENFILIEPGAHLLVRQDRTIRFALDGSYRVTFGDASVRDRVGFGLRGPSLSISVQFVRDP